MNNVVKRGRRPAPRATAAGGDTQSKSRARLFCTKYGAPYCSAAALELLDELRALTRESGVSEATLEIDVSERGVRAMLEVTLVGGVCLLASSSASSERVAGLAVVRRGRRLVAEARAPNSPPATDLDVAKAHDHGPRGSVGIALLVVMVLVLMLGTA